MYDAPGSRNEIQKGYTVMFNLQKTLRLVARLVRLYDYLSGKHLLETIQTKGKMLSVNGWEFKPNVHYSRSHSRIFPQNSNTSREGQVRDDWTLGLGITASFPTSFGKGRKPEKKSEQRKPSAADSEGVQLPKPIQPPEKKKKNNQESDKRILSDEDGGLVQ